MKKIYSYKIGGIVGDLKCIDIQKLPQYQAITYLMKCTKCGREKWMLAPTLARGGGISHSACGKNKIECDPRFRSIWSAMRSRTTNPNMQHYKDYGGRNISSDYYKYFIDFYDDQYQAFLEAEKIYGKGNASLERINVDKDYCKENIIWIHKKDQPTNQRKTIYFKVIYPDGKIEYARDVRRFAKEHNINETSIRDYMNGKLKTCKGYHFERLDRENVTTKLINQNTND